METTRQTHEFKTEVQELLNLIIHSLYSNKDIFLRELISNASDAIDRLRYKSQTEPDLLGEDAEFKIRIIPNPEARTLEITDNGIGMTAEEVMENIGTIAKSGTRAFMDMVRSASTQDLLTPELIGQFGVGFYSAFIVAEKVTLMSRAAGSDRGVLWESSGDGRFTIEPCEKAERGTSILLKLKPTEEGGKDYTQEWVLRDIIRHHSDFVSYPIRMDVETEEPIPESEQLKDKDGKPIGKTTRTIKKEETLNSMKAIWAKNKSEVTEEAYSEFYKHISHDWNDPLTHIHLKMEGVTDYSAILYIPSKAPFDLFFPERKHGIQLYCKRVFIMDDCKALLPEYLRFVKGVVDAPDLNLNVSREILQQDRLVVNIRKNLVRKLLEHLKDMEPAAYETFYTEFGAVLKEGIHTDRENKDKMADLIQYKTLASEGKYRRLKDYVAAMKPDQKEIYYLSGENPSLLMNSPHLEVLKEKGYDVLLMTDPVDEWVVQTLTEYDGKKLKSAEKGDLDIENRPPTDADEFRALFGFVKSALEAKVKDVKASSHLKESMACLSGDTYDMSLYMEKLLKSSGGKIPEVKRILELNTGHPVVQKIKRLHEADKEDPRLSEYSQFLFDMAVIGEGGKIENPSRFHKMVGELADRALLA